MSGSMMSGAEMSVLKTVAFFDTMDYPPTWSEVLAWAEDADGASLLAEGKRSLIDRQLIEEGEGRLALRGRLEPLLVLVRERTPLFPRKVRTARKVTRWLLRNPAVRFVALANTTALAHARDGGDLDFFVVVRHGSLWSTRLIASGLYRLLGRLSGSREQPDEVCLSYFVSDRELNLSRHLLQDGDDPYYRYWFLALLPLADDGLSKELWAANAPITSRHPMAERWMVSPGLEVKRPWMRIPGLSLLESVARSFQSRWFPASIREQMNQGTHVLVSDDVLKFHVDDARARFRDAYQSRLTTLGL